MTFLQLLNPFAPHITEELAESMGVTDTLVRRPWPQYDEAKTVEESINIGVQVNGKLKGVVSLPVDCDEETAKAAALADEKVKAAVEGKNIAKVIVVKNKIINIVVKG